MGEDPGQVGAVTTDDLRRDIAQTRAELGDTAAALGAKADVKGRAKERVEETKTSLRRNPAPVAAAGALVLAALVVVVARRRSS